MLTFSNSEGYLIPLQYSSQDSNGYNIDNEYQDYTEIILENGASAVLMTANSKDSFNYLIWTDLESEFSFLVMGECNIEELIELANNIQFSK